MDEFLETVAVQRTVYHGTYSFTGPQSKKLLTKIEQLESKLMDTVNDPQKLFISSQYIKAFKQFRLVAHACFGINLQPNYVELIADFMETYRSLDISIPLKFHVLERHTQEFIEAMGGTYGLGHYSEHSFEATHHEAKDNWNVNENNPDYDDKMTSWVVNFNGKHL